MNLLKRLLLGATPLLFLLLTAADARAQADADDQTDAISTYFADYVDDEDFTVVYISGKLFDLMESVVSNLDSDDLDAEELDALKDVVQDMRSLRILTSDQADGPKLYREAKAKLLGAKSYEVLMTVREKANTYVDFYVRERDGVLDELLLLVGEDGDGAITKAEYGKNLGPIGKGSFTLLSFEGRIDLEKVGALSKAFDGDDDDDGDTGDATDSNDAPRQAATPQD